MYKKWFNKKILNNKVNIIINIKSIHSKYNRRIEVSISNKDNIKSNNKILIKSMLWIKLNLNLFFNNKSISKDNNNPIIINSSSNSNIISDIIGPINLINIKFNKKLDNSLFNDSNRLILMVNIMINIKINKKDNIKNSQNLIITNNLIKM